MEFNSQKSIQHIIPEEVPEHKLRQFKCLKKLHDEQESDKMFVNIFGKARKKMKLIRS